MRMMRCVVVVLLALSVVLADEAAPPAEAVECAADESLKTAIDSLTAETSRLSEELEETRTKLVESNSQLQTLQKKEEECEGRAKTEQDLRKKIIQLEQLQEDSASGQDKALEDMKKSVAALEQKNAKLQSKLEAETKRHVEQMKELQQELHAKDEEKASNQDNSEFSAKIEDLEKTLEEEAAARKELERELELHRKGLHVVAFHRLIEQAKVLKAYTSQTYFDVVQPQVQALTTVALEKLGQAQTVFSASVKPKIMEQWTKLEPQLSGITEPYQQHVQPYVSLICSKLDAMYEDIVLPGLAELGKQMEAGVEMGEDAYSAFRERGVRTLKRYNGTKDIAVDIFDGCVAAIVLLSVLLLTGPLLRLTWRLVKFTLLLPFRILCCVCCCGCCRSRRSRKALPSPPPKPKATKKKA